MSKISQKKSLDNLQRRQFLTGLSFIAAASTVSHYANAGESFSDEGMKIDETPSATYRETQHIRDYYNSL